MKEKKGVRLVIPLDKDYLRIALNYLLQTADLFGAPSDIQKRVELACEETLVNILKHGEQFEEGDDLEIECTRISGGMKIDIYEKGIPFDPEKGMIFSPTRIAEEGSTKGLGLFLMRYFMDDLIFKNLGVDGIQISLVKTWKTKGEDAQILMDDASPGKTAEAPDHIPDYEVRKAKADDAIEIIRCAYRSHGYTLYDSSFYQTEGLASKIEGGSLFSVIAACSDGKVIGHIGFLFHRPEEMIAEATYAFVEPAYRSSGILGRIIEFGVTSLIKSLPIKGIFQYSVTNHIYSQKSAARSGSKDCGIMLATSQDTWRFKGIQGSENRGRITSMVGFLPLDRTRRTVFLPENHAEMIKKIYGTLGLEREFLSSDREISTVSGKSMFDIARIENEKSSEIFVLHVGADILPETRKNLRRLCIDNKFSAIQIMLSLEDPSTPQLVPAMEKMGFFFSGILPLTGCGDVIMLQYLNNIKVDYSGIQIYSEMGKELLTYIRSCDPWAGIDSTS
ncbi:MAG: ATP-binding protein [Desulfobacterales bacterium]|nr:ATP-binding protein [Desulfobacterales bacterium]